MIRHSFEKALPLVLGLVFGTALTLDAEVLSDITETGVTVNGTDIGQGSGEGWTFAERVLKLTGTGPFVLSGKNEDGEVHVSHESNSTVVLSDFELQTWRAGRPVYSVGLKETPDDSPEAVHAEIRLVGTNSLINTSNIGNDLYRQGGITVYHGSAVRIDKANGLENRDAYLLAAGGNGSAGIGGSKSRSTGRITVSGGTICAKGGWGAAGIGGGNYLGTDGEVSGSVLIEGGVVEAIGLFEASGIGAGREVSMGKGYNIRITGGTVLASEGGIAAATSVALPVRITGGSVSGAVANPQNDAGKALRRVTVPDVGVGSIAITGLPDGYGTKDITSVDGNVYLYLPDGDYDFTVGDAQYMVRVDGDDAVAWRPLGVTVNGVDVSWGSGSGWSFAEKILTLSGSGPFALSGTNTADEVCVVLNGDLALTCEDLVLTSSDSPIVVRSGKKVSLELKGVNALKATAERRAAISVEADANLRISADEDSASLNAFGGAWAAGIGSGREEAMGTLVIAGGCVATQGGIFAPGIGTGYASAKASTSAGKLRIEGGFVTGRGGSNAPGIGCGAEGQGCEIEIAGGRVFVERGKNVNVDLGAQNEEVSVAISGGTVYAYAMGRVNGEKSGFETRVTGGNVQSLFHYPELTDGESRVYEVKLPVPSADGTPVNITGLGKYGTNDIVALNGFVCVYLPDGKYRFAVDDKRYTALIVDGQVTLLEKWLTGISVDGTDVSEGSGNGWTYDSESKILLFSESKSYRLSGSNAEGEVLAQVDLGKAVTIVVDGLCDLGTVFSLRRNASLTIDSAKANELCELRVASFNGSDKFAITIRGGLVRTQRVEDAGVSLKGGTLVTETISSEDGVTSKVTGGNLIANEISPAPTDDTELPIYRVVVNGNWANGTRLTVGNLSGYGTKDIFAVSGKLCLWLPNGEYTFTVNGVRYCAYVNGGETTAAVCTGFTVNGFDLAAGKGRGWTFDGSRLTIDGSVVSSVDFAGEVSWMLAVSVNGLAAGAVLTVSVKGSVLGDSAESAFTLSPKTDERTADEYSFFVKSDGTLRLGSGVYYFDPSGRILDGLLSLPYGDGLWCVAPTGSFKAKATIDGQVYGCRSLAEALALAGRGGQIELLADIVDEPLAVGDGASFELVGNGHGIAPTLGTEPLFTAASNAVIRVSDATFDGRGGVAAGFAAVEPSGSLVLTDVTVRNMKFDRGAPLIRDDEGALTVSGLTASGLTVTNFSGSASLIAVSNRSGLAENVRLLSATLADVAYENLVSVEAGGVAVSGDFPKGKIVLCAGELTWIEAVSPAAGYVLSIEAPDSRVGSVIVKGGGVSAADVRICQTDYAAFASGDDIVLDTVWSRPFAVMTVDGGVTNFTMHASFEAATAVAAGDIISLVAYTNVTTGLSFDEVAPTGRVLAIDRSFTLVSCRRIADASDYVWDPVPAVPTVFNLDGVTLKPGPQAVLALANVRIAGTVTLDGEGLLDVTGYAGTAPIAIRLSSEAQIVSGRRIAKGDAKQFVLTGSEGRLVTVDGYVCWESDKITWTYEQVANGVVSVKIFKGPTCVKTDSSVEVHRGRATYRYQDPETHRNYEFTLKAVFVDWEDERRFYAPNGSEYLTTRGVYTAFEGTPEDGIAMPKDIRLQRDGGLHVRCRFLKDASAEPSLSRVSNDEHEYSSPEIVSQENLEAYLDHNPGAEEDLDNPDPSSGGSDIVSAHIALGEMVAAIPGVGAITLGEGALSYRLFKKAFAAFGALVTLEDLIRAIVSMVKKAVDFRDHPLVYENESYGRDRFKELCERCAKANGAGDIGKTVFLRHAIAPGALTLATEDSGFVRFDGQFSTPGEEVAKAFVDYSEKLDLALDVVGWVTTYIDVAISLCEQSAEKLSIISWILTSAEKAAALIENSLLLIYRYEFFNPPIDKSISIGAGVKYDIRNVKFDANRNTRYTRNLDPSLKTVRTAPLLVACKGSTLEFSAAELKNYKYSSPSGLIYVCSGATLVLKDFTVSGNTYVGTGATVPPIFAEPGATIWVCGNTSLQGIASAGADLRVGYGPHGTDDPKKEKLSGRVVIVGETPFGAKIGSVTFSDVTASAVGQIVSEKYGTWLTPTIDGDLVWAVRSEKVSELTPITFASVEPFSIGVLNTPTNRTAVLSGKIVCPTAAARAALPLEFRVLQTGSLTQPFGAAEVISVDADGRFLKAIDDPKSSPSRFYRLDCRWK